MTCKAAFMLAIVAVPPPAIAHHSVTGQYDPEQRIALSGVIRKVDWINPHTYLHLEVTNDDGSTTNWRLESAPTAMLRKARITPDMLMGGGAVVTVDVILARDGTEHLAWLYRIDYPGGHSYQLSAER
ncbi:MAG TPA: DUF6152 family protein [Gammaproteobacteria bacterium]|nr:DUF6152 family protein [Gammaproteobacteria bacterium]